MRVQIGGMENKGKKHKIRHYIRHGRRKSNQKRKQKEGNKTGDITKAIYGTSRVVRTRPETSF
jgi:hypothetical protein